MGAAIGAGMGNVPAGIGIGLTMGIALSMVGRDGDDRA
jgi:F0F1-type ATP synthase membrane subunit c/vacuolar-type H+-ATPase subunit K